MKTILVTLFFTLLIFQLSFTQQSELDSLKHRKLELENQIKPVSVELKSIESKIEELVKKETLRRLKNEVSFNVKLDKNGNVRNSPSVNGKQLFKLHAGTIVSVHKMQDEYFYVTTYDGKDGWMHEVLFRKDVAYDNMIEGFALLKEEEKRQAKLSNQPESLLRELEANNPSKKEISSDSKVVVSKEQNALTKYNSSIKGIETYGTAKKHITIRIPNRLTEEQIREIATYLRNENRAYDRLFIFYLLPNMEEGSGAWATSHYNKALEIKIMGVDKETESSIKSASSEGEIIGKWYDKTPYIEHSIIISKINGKYILKRTFRDGSVGKKDLTFSTYNGKSKFVYKSDVGEYILIENDGSLSYYDNYGLISKCERIK